MICLAFAPGEIFSRTLNILSRVSIAIRSTSEALRSVVGMGSRTGVSTPYEAGGMENTLDFDLSWFKPAFLQIEETLVIGHYDWNDWHSCLNGEMERPLLEGQ